MTYNLHTWVVIFRIHKTSGEATDEVIDVGVVTGVAANLQIVCQVSLYDMQFEGSGWYNSSFLAPYTPTQEQITDYFLYRLRS